MRMNAVSNEIFVMTFCEYFSLGMKSLFAENNLNLKFIRTISETLTRTDDTLTLLLILDMSSIHSLRNFKESVDFLLQIKSRKKVGVLVSRYNEYLSYYIFRKLNGNVTFFNSHNLKSGLFQKNFITWLRGKTFRPMHVVSRYRDDRYGFSLKEWISLVIPLSGETVQEMSSCMRMTTSNIYQVRQVALAKIGVDSYRQFCELFINGCIHIENNQIVTKTQQYLSPTQ
ncbi:TPA: hypothetical protein ACISV6_004655 [Salmonella enterica subsp. enterica serovar Birkenhead]|nr:hypothetical protein [Salmonella enterica subsp. enterica serovar Thompson]EHI6135494.1 hypothetical protein [Salmonella enterica]